MANNTYYVVNKGFKRGIFGNWSDCEKNVKGFKGAVYKKFNNIEDARAFLRLGAAPIDIPSNKLISPTTVQNSVTSVGPVTNMINTVISKKRRHDDDDDNTSHSTPKYTLTNTQARVPVVNIKEKASNLKELSKAEIPKKSKNDITIVYTDGASSNNGSRFAKAGYGVYWGDNDPRNASVKLKGDRQTNQRAEAMAVIHALQQSQDGVETLEIKTDSQYVINAVTSWSKNWKKNDWKSSNGKEVQNRDLFEKILDLIETRKGKVQLSYVPGHQGNEGNEKADRLAVAGAQL